MKHVHDAAQSDIAERTMASLDREDSRKEMARPTQAPFRCSLLSVTEDSTRVGYPSA